MPSLFSPNQIVIDVLVVGIPERLIGYLVLKYIADALNCFASGMVNVEESVDVGVTIKVLKRPFEIGDGV